MTGDQGLKGRNRFGFFHPQTHFPAMSQSFAAVQVHLIFSTKNRTPLLTKEINGELHPYVAATLAANNCIVSEVGGVEDHLHLCFGIPRILSIAQMVEAVKTSSSKWIKSRGRPFEDFRWQAGYGAFSVSESHVEAVMKYIRNQPEHHKTVTFQDEYRQFLERHRITFDERYMWD